MITSRSGVKRILHVYSGNLFGGVERLLISLAQTPWPGVDHEYALCFEGPLAEGLRAASARVTRLPAVRLSRPWTVLRARRALRRTIASGEYCCVICHSVWTHCAFAPAVRRTGLPLALYLHDIPDQRHPLYRWAWRTAPDTCIFNSRFTEGLSSAPRPAVSTSVLYPMVRGPVPMPAGSRTDLRRALGAPEGAVVILQASRLDRWKGHEMLVDALARLSALPNWVCWIAGGVQRAADESYLYELRQKAEALGIGARIRFIGQRRDVPAVLDACDIYCQPNRTPEPFGMVLVEALYAGKPVVSVARGGALEIVDSSCGLLSEPEPAAVARALRSLLESRDQRLRLGSAGPDRARLLCSPEVFMPGLLAALSRPRGAE